MNYYKRHLGDYARDTGHLSALEHGIYTLLLDWYYTNERPIPHEKAIRIAKGNREETESVLSEFFYLDSEGWRHHRADREVAEYQRRAESNRITGRLGGRPRKNQSETESVSERKPNGNRNVTLATSHKPLAISQEKEAKADASAKGSRLPADWALPDEWRSWAQAERQDLDVDREAASFADFWHGKPGTGGRKANWLATWRNWIRNARPGKFGPSSSPQLLPRLQA